MNCSNCPSYNRGQGTKRCLRCLDYASFEIAEKPAPNICRFPQQFMDNLPDLPRFKTALELLAGVDDISATMILQYTVLKMTHKEIAEYHQPLFSRSGVSRRIASALADIQGKSKPRD